MSGTKLFLDTNIILYLLSGDQTLSDFLQDKQLYISIITEMELLGFKSITEKEVKKLEEFIAECKTININGVIKNQTIAIRRNYGTKLPDSIIAATSMYLDLPLMSADTGFKKIEPLELIHYEK